VLRTLRLRFADRPDHDLAFEPTDDDADPWKLLSSRANHEGRISIGDRESCRIEDILDVIVVDSEPLEGPTFEHGLQDEDVTTALDENYDPPS